MNKKEAPSYVAAYELLRDQILRGEIKPKTKLTETMLAEKLNLSRTPIRAAMTQLKNEGFIKDKHVHVPSEKEIRDVFQVRVILEGYSAKYCAKFISEEALKHLEQCVTTAKHGTKEEILQANYEFHQVLVEETHNQEVIKIINQMQTMIYLMRQTVTLHQRINLIDEHEEILNAIQNGDGALAEKIIQEHLNRDLEFTMNRLKK